MAITIQDVAREAKVSSSTISKVINGPSGHNRISEATRTKVFDVIEELGYVPNLYARSIRRGSTLTIGLIVSDIMHQSVALIVEGAKAEATKTKHQVIIGVSSDNSEEELSYVKNFLSRRVDGLIVLPAGSGENLPEFEKLYKAGFPLALCQPGSTVINVDNATTNVEAGAYIATEYLIKNGHTKIAFCAGHTNWPAAKSKLYGYRRALEDYNIEVYDDLYIKTELSHFASGIIGAKAVLNLKTRPTAIIFHNDEMAAGAMGQLVAAGVRIPGDISLLGLSEMPFSKSLLVPLTTMGGNLHFGIGQKLVSIIVERMAENKLKNFDQTSRIPISIKFAPKLIIRDSTKPLESTNGG